MWTTLPDYYHVYYRLLAVERLTRIELVLKPWQGFVIPFHYSRNVPELTGDFQINFLLTLPLLHFAGHLTHFQTPSLTST